MRRLRISKGGQVSIPAVVRHRCGTHTVVAEDEGERLVLRPVPADPIAAARDEGIDTVPLPGARGRTP